MIKNAKTQSYNDDNIRKSKRSLPSQLNTSINSRFSEPQVLNLAPGINLHTPVTPKRPSMQTMQHKDDCFQDIEVSLTLIN